MYCFPEATTDFKPKERFSYFKAEHKKDEPKQKNGRETMGF